MDEIWAKVLKGLRESNHTALFALINSIDDVAFTAFDITLAAGNDAEFNTLQKNLGLLRTLAGGDYIIITNKKAAEKGSREYIEKLQDLFGDKLEIR